MEAGFSENLLILYHNTQCHILENSILENTPIFRYIRKDLVRQTDRDQLQGYKSITLFIWNHRRL